MATLREFYIFSTITLLVSTLAFLAEYIDSTLGMGYGTTLSHILLIIVAILHNVAGNVHFDFSNDSENLGPIRLQSISYLPKSRDSQLALVMTFCSILGVITASLITIKLPIFYLKLYIGLLVLFMGVYMLKKRRTELAFFWTKIGCLGALASFNKGVSGGGYGPLVTSGQILSGVDSKSSIAITSFAESLTYIVGLCMYLILGTELK
ncbi:MAG: TSUP family transporter [Promethearchaeota archaeon]